MFIANILNWSSKKEGNKYECNKNKQWTKRKKKEEKMNQKTIKRKYRQAERIEPEVTRHVKNASLLCGLAMVNTDHTIKSRKSYTKKVKTKMVREMLPQKAAMAKVKDLIRYTMLLEHYDKEELDKHVEKIIAYLTKAGYKFSEFRNYFEAPKNRDTKGATCILKLKRVSSSKSRSIQAKPFI